MRRSFWIGCCLAGTFFALSGPAQADLSASPALNLAGRVAVELRLGAGFHPMQDLNTYIDTDPILQIFTPRIDPIRASFNFGLNLEYWPLDFLGVGFEGGYLYTQSGVGDNPDGISVLGAVVNPSALELGAYAKYGNVLWDRLLLGGGAGVYDVRLSGAYKQVNASIFTSTLREDWTGGTFGLKAFGSAEYFFSRNFSLALDFGYRLARIDRVLIAGGGTATKADGSNLVIDYSGLFYKLGLRYSFR